MDKKFSKEDERLALHNLQLPEPNNSKDELRTSA